ncbi:hypothetical protein PM082_004452 [Marasmius tenuissimus]|nr:hypothetical protein PM082_004452 [Marasmius tenuissimus]
MSKHNNCLPRSTIMSTEFPRRPVLSFGELLLVFNGPISISDGEACIPVLSMSRTVIVPYVDGTSNVHHDSGSMLLWARVISGTKPASTAAFRTTTTMFIPLTPLSLSSNSFHHSIMSVEMGYSESATIGSCMNLYELWD